jgi:hypothetical protein
MKRTDAARRLKMKFLRQRQRGQILVMATLATFAMCGMLGMAVDLGWSYFVKKSAQAAADSAATASALVVLEAAGEEGPWQCGDSMICQDPAPCPDQISSPPTNNIENGCLYALQNGFRMGGNDGRQNVAFAAGVKTTPPTAPGVTTNYWVTARVTESIPQLFSSMLGNPLGISGARATAGIVDSTVPGSLILLNRENDCLPMENVNQPTCGINVLVQANDNQGQEALDAEGGIMMASTKHGTDVDGRFAGENTGGGTITAPFTYIREAGDYSLSNGATWDATPQNHRPDRYFFKDPLRGKGQPPPPRGLLDRPVAGGTISGSSDPGNPVVLLPGNYFATAQDSGGQTYATGNPIRLTGNVRFSHGGTGFGNYVFFGGLTNQSAGTTVTFEPGRYVFAGARQQANKPIPLFDISVNMTLKDNTAGYGIPDDAGEIFVFTDTNYHGGPDGTETLEIPPMVQPVASQLKQGMSGFQSGNSASVYINLHGLNRNHPALPEELKPFTPIILYQDQANSILKYTPRGYLDTSCGQPECPNTALASPVSTQLTFQASPNLHLWGVSYQPRGSWTTMVGGGGYDAPLQLITGAIRIHANSNVHLHPIDLPLVRKVVALIE